MVGLVMFTHAGLAQSFLEALEMVAGTQQKIEAVAVDPGLSVEDLERRLDAAIKEADDGQGVIVITDLFGGSPANLALARMQPGRVEIVSGLNLAMMLKAVDLRLRKLTDPAVMARAIVREGRENIALASDLLNNSREPKAEEKAGGAD
ncbi:MAG: PTS fructose transporter subunit IIA [Deltaproteobacteria bacterium]|nr:PTS fructose transporter subunit IIA [Deltaproteobacteria bacterium]